MAKKAKAPTAFDMMAAEARESLAMYVGLLHRTDDGKFAVPPQHLLDYVIPAIEDDSLGHTVIIAPPGSIKTNTMIGACGWWLGRDPTMHVAYICNTGPEAIKRSLAIKDVIESDPAYHAIFPETKPNKNRGWAQDNWYLERKNRSDKNPSLTAFGVGGGLGARLHKVVLDDIADDENQKTEMQRKNLHNWLGETVMTRLDPAKGRAIMILTRWHEDDPAAWAIERGWHVVHIPALNEAGESYWPDRFPRPWLACENDEHKQGQCCMKKMLGSVGFARQYLGVVYNAETSIFQPQNWRFFDNPPEKTTSGCIAIDTAGWDQSAKGDYCCLSAWVTDGINFYCLDVQRGHWLFSEAERRALEMQETHNLRIVVEDVPWSRPLIDRLRKVTWGVIGVPTKGKSKTNRARAIGPLHEAGNLWIPRNATWKEKFVAEHAAFPDGRNDDMVDTTSLGAGELVKRQPSGIKKAIVGALPLHRRWEGVRA